MSGKIPPLGSLRAFEAVGRRLSFTKAADELHVTPGAVSQQVRALELYLDRPLFKRTRRSVAMTEDAIRMLPDIQLGLDVLAKATSKRPSVGVEKSLTISVAPSFASKWLLPRLVDFSRQHGDIDLRILATVALSDLNRDDVDLAIRLGRGPYANLRTEALFGEGLTPLCAPSLLRKNGKFKSVDDLKKYRLLHDVSIPGDSHRNSWLRWLEFAGAIGVPHQRGTRFSLAELAMQAAIDGAGVVLGRVVLAERDIATGRLVRPFKIVMPLDEKYLLVMPKGPLGPEAQRFRDWLHASINPKRST